MSILLAAALKYHPHMCCGCKIPNTKKNYKKKMFKKKYQKKVNKARWRKKNEIKKAVAKTT